MMIDWCILLCNLAKYKHTRLGKFYTTLLVSYMSKEYSLENASPSCSHIKTQNKKSRTTDPKSVLKMTELRRAETLFSRVLIPERASVRTYASQEKSQKESAGYKS